MSAAPAMLIRIATDLKELKANLAEGKNQIETTTQAMHKLASSLDGSKLEQRAHNIVAAVNQIGGAAKLSDAEQARLNRTLQAYIDKATRMGKEVPTAIRELADATRQIQPATETASVSVAKLAAAYVTAEAVIGTVKTAFTAYVNFIRSSIDSFAEAEAAQRKLNTALQAQGSAAPDVRAQYAELGSELQRTTVYSADLLTEMQALLVQVGNVMPDQMEGALRAATDLASGLGIDLQSATMLVAKAFEGNTSSLERYGIVVDDAKLRTQGMQAVLDAVQQRFGGQAQAEVDTYSGRLQQLANSWDDLKELVGEFATSSDEFRGALAALNLVLQDITRESGAAATPVGKLWELWQNYIEIGQTITPGVAQFHRALGEMADEADRASGATEEATKSIIRFYDAIHNKAAGAGKMPLAEYNRIIKELTTATQKDIESKLKAQAEAFKKLQDSLFSRDAINRANDMSRALGDIGNSSKLTAEKKRELREAVLRALDAYDALGQRAPARLREIAAATTELLTITRSFSVTGWVPLKAAVEDAGESLHWLASSTIPEAAAAAAEADRAFREWAEANGVLIPTIADTRDEIETLQHDGLLDAVDNFMNLTDAILGSVSAFAQIARSANGAQAALGGLQVGANAGRSIGAMAGLTGAGLATATIMTGGAAALVAWGIAMGNARKEAAALRQAMQAEFDAIRRSLIESVGPTGDLAEAMKALGLDFSTVFHPNVEKSLIAIAAIQREFAERVRKTNEDFAPLLQSATQLGIRLPASLLASIEHLVTIGVLTGQNADLLQQLTDSAEVDWKKMQEAAERYGIDLGSLGDKFQQLKISDAAKQIINDFDLLRRGGADVGGVLFGMQDEISKLVQDAKKFGLEIPENMKPWIEELLRAGLLVDENGNALTDLAGLNFGEPILTEFEKITAAIEELIKTLDRLAASIGNLPTPPGVPPPGGGTQPAPPPGGDGPDGRAFGTYGATGRWWEDFGAGRDMRLHGVETVLRPSDVGPFVQAHMGGTGKVTVPVQVMLDRHVLGEVMIEILPSQLGLLGGSK